MIQQSAPLKRFSKKPSSVLPGFKLTLTYTFISLIVVVLVPLLALVVRAGSQPLESLLGAIFSERALHAYGVSLRCAFYAAVVNVFFGTGLAWVLVRYQFPGKRVIDALVDLPLALPTAVAGIALTTLYSADGWLGQFLMPLGITVAYTPLGITVALMFVGIPFVVRTVQPVIQDLEYEVEDAAASLGAKPAQIFFRILLPQMGPAIVVGFAMAFARGVGEYGSVIFIAGNVPKVSEILPLLIVIKLEQFDYAGASALAAGMLVISFCLLLAMNYLQRSIHPSSAQKRV
jgi:sulfate transport system permease protein